MALNLEDKKALVAEVAEVAAKAQSVVAAEYRGLTVGQMTELRAKARKSGCTCVSSKTRWHARLLPARRSNQSDPSSKGLWCSHSRRTTQARLRAW